MTEPSEAAMQVAREIQEIYMAKLRRIYPAHAWVFPPETRFQIAQLIDREALASESGFVQHYIDALETQITTSEARNAELVAALITIRGWREIGHAVTLGERLQAVEDIAHQALVKHEREKTK